MQVSTVDSQLALWTLRPLRPRIMGGGKRQVALALENTGPVGTLRAPCLGEPLACWGDSVSVLRGFPRRQIRVRQGQTKGEASVRGDSGSDLFFL